jgi:hypothetical protein
MVSEPTMNLFTLVVIVSHRSIPLVSLEAMVARFLQGSIVVQGQKAAPFPSPLKANFSKGKFVPRLRYVSPSNYVSHLVETRYKVFHSSSAQIGRLIENLSQGADSGSFNFLPTMNRGPGHSATSSLSTNDINWTVEERLDRMLGAMTNNNTS